MFPANKNGVLKKSDLVLHFFYYAISKTGILHYIETHQILIIYSDLLEKKCLVDNDARD